MFGEILTARLKLRCLTAEDAKELFAYRAHPDVVRYQSWHPESLEGVQAFIDDMTSRKWNEPGWYQIGIALNSGGTLIGDCGIHVLESDSRLVELGITIAPEYQSRGYASEALVGVLDLLFTRLDKHRVTASVDPRNLASIALMARIGMRKEGHLVQSLWFNDSWADDVVFAMLATEFPVVAGVPR